MGKARLAISLLLAALAGSWVAADEPGSFVLAGDLSAFYASGNFVVWTPKKAGGAPAMAMAAATNAKPAGAAEPAKEERPYNVIAETPLRPDGTFQVEGAVDAPKQAFFYVLDAVGHEGHRFAPMKGNAFILESGTLRLHMSRPGRFHIEGGSYNDAVYNSWRRADAYMQAQADYEQTRPAVEGETEAEQRARTDRAAAHFDEVLRLETEGRRQVATSHPDPLVRKLVIDTAWLGGPWILEGLRSLAAMTPNDPWVVERLARAEEGARKRAEEAKRFAVGAGIRDFVAETLTGESVRLADARADSKLVLVEFWASWCGPCRVEIPHMKQAYERYRDRGFEIVSFTIDNDREDWEIASEEEELPWANLGMGEEADAPRAYNVTGVPKNYLVDSASGEIVARDLRGHQLDEKLAELLN